MLTEAISATSVVCPALSSGLFSREVSILGASP
jgi:hypothetical protein